MSNKVINTIDQATVDGEILHRNETEYYSQNGIQYKRVIFYVCNQKKCENCSAKDGECKHTTNLKYAKNYNSVPPNKRLEKSFRKEYMMMDQPTVIFIEEEHV